MTNVYSSLISELGHTEIINTHESLTKQESDIISNLLTLITRYIKEGCFDKDWAKNLMSEKVMSLLFDPVVTYLDINGYVTMGRTKVMSVFDSMQTAKQQRIEFYRVEDDKLLVRVYGMPEEGGRGIHDFEYIIDLSKRR